MTQTYGHRRRTKMPGFEPETCSLHLRCPCRCADATSKNVDVSSVFYPQKRWGRSFFASKGGLERNTRQNNISSLFAAKKMDVKRSCCRGGMNVHGQRSRNCGSAFSRTRETGARPGTDVTTGHRTETQN